MCFLRDPGVDTDENHLVLADPAFFQDQKHMKVEDASAICCRFSMFESCRCFWLSVEKDRN